MVEIRERLSGQINNSDEPLAVLRPAGDGVEGSDNGRRRILEQALKDAAKIRAEALDILVKAKKMIEGARLEAGRLRQEAVEGARDEGYTQGLETGLAEGERIGIEEIRRKAESEQAALVRALALLLKTVEDERQALLAAARNDLVRLAAAIASAVCKAEVTAHEAIAMENVARAVELTAKKSDVEIRVSPADMERIRNYVPSLVSSLARGGVVTVAAHEDVTPGGCVVYHNSGFIDATIETQLTEIRRQLLGSELNGNDAGE